jgi:hypothetical protein
VTFLGPARGFAKAMGEGCRLPRRLELESRGGAEERLPSMKRLSFEWAGEQFGAAQRNQSAAGRVPSPPWRSRRRSFGRMAGWGSWPSRSCSGRARRLAGEAGACEATEGEGCLPRRRLELAISLLPTEHNSTVRLSSCLPIARAPYRLVVQGQVS